MKFKNCPYTQSLTKGRYSGLMRKWYFRKKVNFPMRICNFLKNNNILFVWTSAFFPWCVRRKNQAYDVTLREFYTEKLHQPHHCHMRGGEGKTNGGEGKFNIKLMDQYYNWSGTNISHMVPKGAPKM
jgi:hypothetical protein